MKDSEPQHTYRNPNLSQTPLSAPYCILLLLMTGMVETVGFPWTWAQIWVLVLLSETFASELTLACLGSLIYRKMDVMTDMERTESKSA